MNKPLHYYFTCKQVKPVPIDYARSAKRLDVKKLKAKMWEVITESSEDMKENMVSCSAFCIVHVNLQFLMFALNRLTA